MPEYDLVMPFVACQSKGGPYEDQAYVSGYEMGVLDGTLANSKNPMIAWRQMIHEPNRDQADLIAMRYGFQMEVLEELEEWLDVQFVRAEDA